MQIGVTVPNNWGIEDARQALAFGPLAEELGFASVWVIDHLFNNGYIGERLDDKPYYHPLTFLSYLAATTRRVTLGTSVLVLPYHNPVELAKMTASLDQMSGGRVTLGVGAGAMAEEFAALGIPIQQRGALANESIRIMKELWANPWPSYHSRRWNFDRVRFSPKPAQPGGIPIWVGGASPGALKRAAALGDGWHPSGVTPEQFTQGRDEIRRLAAAAGRDLAGFTWSARVEVEVHGGPSSQRAASRARVSADPEEMIAALAAYRQAGVGHAVLALNSGDVAALIGVMRRVSRDVLPNFQ